MKYLLLTLSVFAMSAATASQLATRGLWVQFERRGWSSGYWPGEVIEQFNDVDSVVGHKVSDEVSLQLDAMHEMGVNTITLEIRTADKDANSSFPTCHVNPVLGFRWPQPTPSELANLAAAFELIRTKGFKVILVLTNTHMEEQPPTNSQTWLSAILNVVKNHPAFDFVVFNGDAHVIDTNGDGLPDSCGGQAEAPLWLGPGAYAATYVKWAFSYAMSLGMSPARLGSGTVVGDFFTDSHPPAGPEATDGHLWKPVAVMKSILDSLSIPNDQRVYALSFYEHRKCATARSLPCVDATPASWAEQTVQDIFATIGAGNGARVVAYEMGNMVPVESTWSTSQALENLLRLMATYGMDGGSFWRWTSFTNDEDANSSLAEPIKRRATTFNYNTTKNILECYYTGTCPLPTPIPSSLGNISTRLRVETDDNVLIGGFIVTGTQPKKVIVRAIGTSLPFTDKLADPILELHGPNGLIESNNNWVDSPNKQAIFDSTIPPSSDLESAIVRTLAANNAGYTAIVRGVNGGTGIGLVEAYDLDIPAKSKLANISTRGFVQTGDNVLIAGTIVVGQAPQRVIIRAIGPSLPIVGKMQNPTLELRDSNGGLLQANDNWGDSPDEQAIIDTTIPPSHDLESAIVGILPANNASYTAIVRGVNNTTGIAVVEIYALP